MLQSELEVKLLQNATFRIYMAVILKMCNTYNFYSISVGFGDHKNMRVDTNIVFLSGLQVKIPTKPNISIVAWPFCSWPLRKCPQGCQAGIRLIPTQEVSKMSNQP